jgi:hypothetical protein
MVMLVVGIIFLLLAGLFGSILFRAVFKNKKTPKPVVFLHGSVAFFAILVLVGYIAAGHTDTLLITSLVLFLLAAMGGFYMFSYDMRKKPIPKAVALIHPVIAIAGFICLIVFVLQQPVVT